MLSASTRKRYNRKFILPAGSVIGDLKLDVGCGDSKHDFKNHGLKDYIGLDIYDYGQDIVWNIEQGIPLPDNSCSEIFCSHVVEHLDDLITVMNEFWRILKPNGKLSIVCPHK